MPWSAGWILGAGRLLVPVAGAMADDLRAGGYIQADETRVPVQSERTQGANHLAWMWEYSRPEGPVVFDFRLNRAREGPAAFLKDFRGMLQSDAYAAYEKVGGTGMIHAGCWAHARRGFIEAESSEKKFAKQAILKILRRQHVSRQDELVDLLRKRGIDATQSSISRDLRQLGISKLDQEYRPVGDEEEAELGREMGVLAEFVLETRTAGPYQTVVKTAAGAAGQVALALDRSGWPEIVGTVSGDDTIFIATRTGGEQRRLVAKLRARFTGV